MKISYLLLLAVFPFLLNAQSFTYQSSSGLNLSGPDTVVLIAHVDVTNNSGGSLNVLCRISDTTMTGGHSKYFCFGDFCYPPNQSVASTSVPLKSGVNAELKGYVLPNNLIGSDDVTYQFYDESGLSDTLSVSIHYDFSLTAVADLKKRSFSLATASPNPARNLTAISYSYSFAKDARIVVRNLLGSPVKEIKLQNNQGIALLDAMQFASGIYVYSLMLDGSAVASKKLVVAH